MMDQPDQTEDQPRKPGAKSEPDSTLDTMSIAVFDVDARIFRTMLDSFIRVSAVARAGLDRDYSRYLSPVRVFIALFSFQFVVAALFGTPLVATIESLTAGLEDVDAEAWLASARLASDTPLTIATINNAIGDAQAIMIWPITVIASLPYLLLLKLYRPSIPLWGHLQIYLTGTNASFIVMIALIPSLLLGPEYFSLAMILAMLVYFILTGILLRRFYAQSAGGTAWRMVGLVAMLPVTLLLSFAGTTLTIDRVLETEFGLDLIGLWSPDLLSPDTTQ